jgi:hypothetical protein
MWMGDDGWYPGEDLHVDSAHYLQGGGHADKMIIMCRRYRRLLGWG